MSEAYCPLCYAGLEVIEVAPCMECGHSPVELQHALFGQHRYAEMRIFGELTLILCDFCLVDFGSFNAELFGLPKNTRIGYEKMQFLRDIEDIYITKDKICPSCNYRLPFLSFIKKAQELHVKCLKEK
ncbi:hypothetical protein FK216_00210 [Moraxellaceae bacterium AER2_44_116]|nr:hypothetical protein [Moraxellaceae bacterium]TQC99712.1 hypothetical protein FK216_00210 [Moraxellaceae bacterium AER2_44_116]